MELVPRHILIKVFSHLNANEVIVASKVCQLWREIIKSNPYSMKSLTLKITTSRSNDTITIIDHLPRGRHENFEIIDYLGDFMILKHMLSTHQLSLSTIKITRPAVWRAKMFIDAFCVVKNLRQLTLDSCQIDECEEKIVSEESFWSLRHLTIINCNCEIFEIFKKCRLTSLYVEFSPTFNLDSKVSMSSLTNLLRNSSNLSSLTTIGVTDYPQNFLSEKINELKFHLECLKIDEVEGPFVDENWVIEFLGQQRKSLKDLSILSLPMNEHLCELINVIKLNKIENT